MSFFRTINQYVFNLGDFLKDYLLLAFRLYWGWKFFLSGINKFGNIQMVAEFFDSILIPFPWQHAYIVATIETVGGLCLFLGLASRVVSIPLAFIMIVALFTAHLSETLQAFANPQRLINQLPFNYLLTCLVVLCFGPGKFSLDAFIGNRPFNGSDPFPKGRMGSK